MDAAYRWHHFTCDENDCRCEMAQEKIPQVQAQRGREVRTVTVGSYWRASAGARRGRTCFIYSECKS